MDLRSVAIYYESVGSPATDFAGYWPQVLRSSAGVRTFSGDVTPAFYRMVGSIPATLWGGLQDGHPSTVGALGIVEPFAAMLSEDRTPVLSSGPIPDVLRHPLESFVDGQLGKAVLQAAHRRQDMVGIVTPSGDGQTQWRGNVPMPEPLDIGIDIRRESLASLTREQYERWVRQFQLRVGYQDETTIAIQFLNGLFQSATFTDPIVPTTDLVGYDRLPREIREALWLGAKEAALKAAPAQSAMPGQKS